MTSKDLKIQIALKVTKVAMRNSYGIDKRFIEKIEPGDMILIQTNLYDGIRSGTSKDAWEVIITNKGISKFLSNQNRVRDLFTRITEFEQIGLL